VDAIMRGLDAGVVVVGADLKVHSWNRWSENAWGFREEEVIGHPFVALEIGLPVQKLDAAVRQAVADAKASEAILDAIDRRGRALRCRVRVAPLIYDDRSTQGAVILMDHVTAADE
jgi:two-component system CheB/CheR fusion protein